eukprot:1143774-Pelagomonas_calceolata.AAC.1
MVLGCAHITTHLRSLGLHPAHLCHCGRDDQGLRAAARGRVCLGAFCQIKIAERLGLGYARGVLALVLCKPESAIKDLKGWEWSDKHL